MENDGKKQILVTLFKAQRIQGTYLHSGETVRMWWQPNNWRVKYKRWINSAVEA